MSIKTAIILAGGKGTRMFPVSDYVPKPLIKIREIPLIDHCIDNLRNNGINNIYVTYGYKSDMLVSHVEKKVSGLINTIGQDNAYIIFNTIVKYLDAPTLIIPCDIIMRIDFQKLSSEYQEGFSYIVPVNYKNGMQADFLEVDKYNRITKIGRNFKSSICASGIQICNPYFINCCINNPVSNWYQIWNHLLDNKKLLTTDTRANEWNTYDNLEQLLVTNEST